MGAVFTPGLKVAEDSVVVKERRLPLEGELLVAEGAAVGPDCRRRGSASDFRT